MITVFRAAGYLVVGLAGLLASPIWLHGRIRLALCRRRQRRAHAS